MLNGRGETAGEDGPGGEIVAPRDGGCRLAVREIPGEGGPRRPRGDRIMASFFLGRGRTPPPGEKLGDDDDGGGGGERRPNNTLSSPHLVRRPLEVRPREHVRRPLRRRLSRVGRHLFALARLFCALLRDE